ncbi:uncharacterized protein UHO2_04905 [Ustilago hordei]|uniref:uncharacterized protein n=1 Tax=Ustilago hordei TaxID=120017 RepID=UPI001A51437B|nr:uncharacterized protein UHO2_04905 [Ustilago hordei]SYW82988.1 related to monocarboxylate permease [Ustilago hordei]
MSPYLTRSKTAIVVPPAEVATTSSRCRQVVLQLHPHEDPATEANPPAPMVSAQVADPLALPVVRSPLEPLFLGMDDDIIVPSPLPSPFIAPIIPNLVGNDYSPASPAIDLYEVDARLAAVDRTTPEWQATWEAELARSPTPPPTADEVIDVVLAVSRAGTPVYQPEVQPLTPPPHWVGHQMPPPPPPDRHLPSNREIAGWAEGFVMANLLMQVADGHYPCDWDVPVRSLAAKRLHRLVMLRLMEGCMPWPSWQCRRCFNLGILPLFLSCFTSAFTNPFGEQTRIPHACVHCYLAGLGHSPQFPPSRMGPSDRGRWVIWHFRRPELLYVKHHDQLYSEHQPHESVMESGGPPDFLHEWVAPTKEELVIWSSLAPPPAPSSYVDM